MSSTGSIGHRGSGVAEEQVLLNEMPSRNGVTITPTRTPIGKRGTEFEKQPFLTTEPVRLTPAWEETNLPNDELNFKEVTMENAQLEMNPPHDRLKLVYLTLMLHGIGTLMPWNMFITAKDYFVEYKLSQNYTGLESDYVTNFMPFIGFASQVPNLIFNWLNIFLQLGGNLTTRIVWTLLVEVIVFVVTVILAMGDSSQWPGIFFWVTIGSVIILNMANGIYQNTVYGIAAKLPFKYTGAIVLGSNVCGTFTAIVSIISSAAAPNPRTAAIYYFIAALFVLLACMDTYFALPLNRFYRYHEMLNQKEMAKRRPNSLGSAPRIPYSKVFLQCFPQCFNVFFIFFVTLTVFPAIHSDIKRADSNFFVGEKYYTHITCFLTFNLCACIGSWLATFGSWPSSRWVVVPVVLRVLFIPIFLICNYQPLKMVRLFPILIVNDWVYWSIAVVFALSSGYFSSVCMMYCPRMVKPEHASIAGMFGAASLITGIFSGIMFSAVMPWFVSTVSWSWLESLGQL
ncbi:equilibrative nucleoside transporter 1 [Homalodisca vitripennis]|uniref:equilibrative nucleoside transporter 1 n=1 Tax=Homalodisca vitripennis TaxID=197043 RepID=UPI001EEC8FEA|nr:equilibrative nucleoside transporter 1 [Homalodisca vitripennis]